MVKNPSEFFYLWDINCTTYSVVIQLFKDLLRSLSLKSDIAHQKIIFIESRS